MPRRVRATLAALVTIGILVVPFGSAGAATTEVAVDDDFFSPARTAVKVGGAVHWSRAAGAGGLHNVREDGAIFRSGAATTGAIDLTVTFSAGTFHYVCEVHAPDMAGLIKVKSKVSAAPKGLPFTVRWATSTTDSGSTFDVKYRIGSGTWKNWKTDTTSLKGVFGKNQKPVKVRAGKRYSFRVRSQEGTATSRWSPVRSFKPGA